MPENKLTFRNCIRELLGFVRPYRIRLSIALFMIIVTNLTFALNPMMEGKITTQLASDGAKILQGVPGAHVQFFNPVPFYGDSVVSVHPKDDLTADYISFPHRRHSENYA